MKLKEIMNEVNLPPEVKGITIKKTGSHKDDADHGWDVQTTTLYDIKNKSGKKIGELSYEDYFGNITGQIWGRDLPNIGGYGGGGTLQKLHRFFKSKTGQRWLEIARKQGKIK